MKKFPFALCRTRTSFLIFLLLILFSAGLSQANPIYNVFDLGELITDGRSWAYSINDDGIAVGRAQIDSSGNFVACRFNTDKTVSNLGTLDGYSSSYAYSINKTGTIVGWSQNSSTDREACTFSAGSTPVSLIDNSMAIAVNNSGTIVGRNDGKAYNFSSGNPLGGLGGNDSMAIAINNNSTPVIVGTAQNESGTNIACIFNGAGNATSLCLTESWAYAVNDSNQIVGRAKNDQGFYHACSFEEDGSGIEKDFGTLGGNYSIAFGNNNLGDIVGYAEIASGAAHACLFDGSGAHDLNDMINDSSWTLRYAFDINNDGKIVGVGMRNGVERAFMLVVVPEPATVIILSLGLMIFPAKLKR